MSGGIVAYSMDVSNLGFGDLGLRRGLRVKGCGLRVTSWGLRSLGLIVSGLGSVGLCSSKFRVLGSGFKAYI